MRLKENKSSYDSDLYQWSIDQAALLRQKKLSDIDIENIAEEIESLGKSEKKSLNSTLVSLLVHMLKNHFTPERKGNSSSWDGTIYVTRKTILSLIKTNKSFKKKIKTLLEEAYEDAAQQAMIESGLFGERDRFPKKCPWTIEEILGE